jgi:hypothetical protein
VVLECAKDRILGVDTLGQHVTSCVQYGMACLLFLNTTGSVSFSVEWGMASYFVTYFMTILCESPEQHGVRGDVCVGILSTTRGDRLFEKP